MMIDASREAHLQWGRIFQSGDEDHLVEGVQCAYKFSLSSGNGGGEGRGAVTLSPNLLCRGNLSPLAQRVGAVRCGADGLTEH